MWIIKCYEFFLNVSFVSFGVYPRNISGLKGLFFSPFIHKDFQHLFNNTIPLLILGSMLWFFYKKIAHKIFFWLFFISGLWTWVIGRASFHIGASGLIYALASFIFISGTP